MFMADRAVADGSDAPGVMSGWGATGGGVWGSGGAGPTLGALLGAGGPFGRSAGGDTMLGATLAARLRFFLGLNFGVRPAPLRVRPREAGCET